MIPFGLIFIGLAIYTAVYNFKNATSKNRYSIVDFVDEREEPDPLNEKYASRKEAERPVNREGTNAAFCPYCGNTVDSDFDFCPQCGKQLPDQKD